MPNIAKIMKHVVTSAASAEIGILFINTRQAIPVRCLLEKRTHKQPPTPTQADNTTAIGFITKNLNPKMTKAEDMNHWFLRDQQDRKRFRYYWREGKFNDTDCQSKHPCSVHHQQKRTQYLKPQDVLNALRHKQGKPVLTF